MGSGASSLSRLMTKWKSLDDQVEVCCLLHASWTTGHHLTVHATVRSLPLAPLEGSRIVA